MEDGYIMLSRKFFASKIWQAARAFNESEAWLDLIQSARFEPSEITSRIGSYEITWHRGQYPASVRFLSKKWGRSERWVRSFLNGLKRDKMISIENAQGSSVITLLNYDKYNPLGNEQKRPPDTPFDTLNTLDANELLEKLTHLLTHPRHTIDTNTKKDNNLLLFSSSTRTGAREEDFFLRQMKGDKSWLEAMAMRYHLPVEGIQDEIENFALDVRCRGTGDEHKTGGEWKSHFNNWLLIKQEKERKMKNAESTGRLEDRRRGYDLADEEPTGYGGTF